MVPGTMELVCVSNFGIGGMIDAEVSDGGEVCCIDVSPPEVSNGDEDEDDMSSVLVWSKGVSGEVVVVVSGACWGVVRVSENESRSEVDDSPKGLSGPGSGPGGGIVVVPLAPRGWKRFISLFRNLGLSNSSRFWAGTAAAKHIAGSKVDSRASEAANITVDLLSIVSGLLLFARRFYYDV